MKINKLSFMAFAIIASVVVLFASCTIKCEQKSEKPQQLVETRNPEGIDVDRLARIDSAFQRNVDAGLLPQAVVMVVHKGEIAHYKAYGWRDIENQIPCERDDIFRMASQTKAIAVVAVMTLWEQGYFQLDEPIKKYIPAFANMKVLKDYDPATGTYTTEPANKDITIRHLFSHTSGISYSGVHARIFKDAGLPSTVTKDSITLAWVVDSLASLPLAHHPGEGFTYSKNIEVLGRLAEILTGKPIDQFIKETVLDPLGMNETAFYQPEDRAHRLVKLYTYPFGKGETQPASHEQSPSEVLRARAGGGPLQPSTHPVFCDYPISGAKTYFSTGAGLSGPIMDYAKFCQMILNGGEFNGKRIIGRKTLEMMQRNQTRDMRGDVGFGLAWDVYRDEYLWRTPASKGTMRWGGMFGTDYIIDPEEELIVLMYTNFQTNGTGVNFKELAHNTAYQALK
jgi:CubicO group peptidase (beta-lactamase class C family)